MGADGMDGNERLLSQVLQERSAHGRLRGPGSGWLLLGSVVLVFLAVGALFRVIGSTGGVPAPRPAAVGTVAAPSGARAAGGVATSVPQPVATTVPQTGGPRRYVVQPGDSLETIASRAGVSPATLASVNELDDPDLLQPGSELEIPTTDGVLHVVAPGETLRSIAQQYSVDVSALIAANRLADPDHIVAGLRLFIPGGRAPVTAETDGD
jgi:LysM repeat protein